MAGSDDNLIQRMKEASLMMNTFELLDEENQSIISEVLKCDVCLELPVSKQVKICEKGHHFCSACHKKMKFCGICRGELLQSRNFVVEELVTKLSPILGVPNARIPPPKILYKISSGSYPCLHICNCKMAAFAMLPHLRKVHSDSLTDNLRSNPYTQRFSYSYSLRFEENQKYIHSVFVSDMGIFTLQCTFSNFNFSACLRILGDDKCAELFRHQIGLKFPYRQTKGYLEFALTRVPPLPYTSDDDKNKLKIDRNTLMGNILPGDEMIVFFSIWGKTKKDEKDEEAPEMSLAPGPRLRGFFQNDRKTNRNRNRNLRRRRLREMLKASALPDASSTLARRVSSLVL